MKSRIHPRSVLFVGFLTLVILVISTSLLSLNTLADFNDRLEAVVNNNNVRIKLSNAMRQTSRERTLVLHEMFLTEDPFERDRLFMRMRALGEAFLKYRGELLASDLDSQEKAMLDRQGRFSSQAGPLQNEVYEALARNDKDTASRIFIEQAIPAQNRAIGILDDYIHLQQIRNRTALQDVSKRFVSAKRQILLLGLTIAGLTITIGYFLRRRLTYMIAMLEQSGERLSNVNLRLQHRESQERAIRDNVLDAIITIDERGVVQSWNRAAESMFGYQRGEVIGHNISIIVPTPHKEQHDHYLHNYLQTGRARIIGIGRDVEGQRKDGSVFPLNLGVTEVMLEGRRIFIGILRDISEQKASQEALRRAKEELEWRVIERTRELETTNQRLQNEIDEHKKTQEQLRYMANYDNLTGLPNRALYTDHLRKGLAQAQRRGEQLALLYIDLDGFKHINDSYGHAAGDEVLREVANRFSALLREEDLIARIGGDEFTVILGPAEQITPPAEVVAHKLLVTLEPVFHVCGHEHSLGASIGISIYPRDCGNAETIQRNADLAMYEAKSGGRNRVVFYSRADIVSTDAPA